MKIGVRILTKAKLLRLAYRPSMAPLGAFTAPRFSLEADPDPDPGETIELYADPNQAFSMRILSRHPRRMRIRNATQLTHNNLLISRRAHCYMQRRQKPCLLGEMNLIKCGACKTCFAYITVPYRPFCTNSTIIAIIGTLSKFSLYQICTRYGIPYKQKEKKRQKQRAT